MQRKIAWIASYPKSGNTWVRMFLEAYITGRLDINAMVATVPDDVSGLYAIGDNIRPIWEEPPDVLVYCRPMAMLRLVRMADDDTPLIVKTHAPCINPNGIELLPEGMTKAVVHIVRDPRDVCPSYANHMGVSIDQAIEDMRNKLKHTTSSKIRVGGFFSSWDLHTRSFLDVRTHNIRTWRYEDLRAWPAKHMAEILEHIGIEAEPRRVTEALEVASLEKARSQEKENGFVEASPKATGQFFGAGDVGGWKRKLTAAQAIRIFNAFERQMRRVGYERRLRAA